MYRKWIQVVAMIVNINDIKGWCFISFCYAVFSSATLIIAIAITQS